MTERGKEDRVNRPQKFMKTPQDESQQLNRPPRKRLEPEQEEPEDFNRQKQSRKKIEQTQERKPLAKHEINIENYQRCQATALEKYDPKGIPANYLVACFSGYIQTAQLLANTDLQVNYELNWGEDWRDEYLNPPSTQGVSQFCESKNCKVTFNLPFQCTLTSPTIESWPQLVIIFKGFDFFGRKITKGYAQMHFPVLAGTHQYTANIYAPEATFYQNMLSWLYGTSIQYKRDAQKIILKGEGRQIGKIRTIGKVSVLFNVTLRNFQRLGYR